MKFITFFLIQYFFSFNCQLFAQPSVHSDDLTQAVSAQSLANQKKSKDLKKLSLAAVDLLLELEYKNAILSSSVFENQRHHQVIKKNQARISEAIIRLRVHNSELNSYLYPLLKLRKMQSYSQFLIGTERVQGEGLEKAIEKGLSSIKDPLVRHFVSLYLKQRSYPIQMGMLLSIVAESFFLNQTDFNLYFTQKKLTQENLDYRWQKMVESHNEFDYLIELKKLNHRLTNIAKEIDFIWYNDILIVQQPSLFQRLGSYLQNGDWVTVSSGKTCEQLFK